MSCDLLLPKDISDICPDTFLAGSGRPDGARAGIFAGGGGAGARGGAGTSGAKAPGIGPGAGVFDLGGG